MISQVSITIKRTKENAVKFDKDANMIILVSAGEVSIEPQQSAFISCGWTLQTPGTHNVMMSNLIKVRESVKLLQDGVSAYSRLLSSEDGTALILLRNNSITPVTIGKDENFACIDFCFPEYVVFNVDNEIETVEVKDDESEVKDEIDTSDGIDEFASE